MNKLQNDLRCLQAQIDQLQVRNSRFGRTYNPSGRNQCTTFGEVICNNCLRVGHISRNCRGLLRDPRIPQQPRFGPQQTPRPPSQQYARPQFTQRQQPPHPQQGN